MRRDSSRDELLAFPESPGTVTLRGVVDRVVYSNPQTGWSVLRVSCGDEVVSVVGTTGEVGEGEEIEARGRWVESSRFGHQFHAQTVSVGLPTTLEGMRRFLATCGLPGVGERLA